MKEFMLDALAENCKSNCQLYNVMFVLLSQCNENCVHCYIPEHTNPGLPTDKVNSLIDEARALGAMNVTLTGGEILLRKDLLEIIAYARSKYMRVFLMSNGFALDEATIAELANLHIANFSTTIFSMNPEINDAITRKRGSLEKLLGNIQLLKKHGIKVTVKTPLMKMNCDSYRDTYEYARKNGFEYRTTATIFSKINGDTSPHNLEITDELTRVVRETDAINALYRKESIHNRSGKIPCSAGFSNICINYDGTVWPCNTLTFAVGDVYQQSLEEIWNRSDKLSYWRTIAALTPIECESCEIAEKCTRCPGLAYMENGDLLGCSTSAKRVASCR